MSEIVIDPFPDMERLRSLWQRAWGGPPPPAYDRVLRRSLAHVAAVAGEKLAGFVNVAWDGGMHAFLLDTCVDPDFRGAGLGTRLVAAATDIARERGAVWLHVDFEPHLAGFYRGCGFRPTEAGLVRLR